MCIGLSEDHKGGGFQDESNIRQFNSQACFGSLNLVFLISNCLLHIRCTLSVVRRADFDLQARGLDVLPTTISRFRKGGDSPTADLLESVIYPEEITHCAAGVKWFTYLCLQRKLRADNECIAKSREDVKSDNRSTSSDEQLATVSESDGEDLASKLPSLTIRDTNKGTGAATRQESKVYPSNAQQFELPVVSKVSGETGGTPANVVAAFHSVVRKYFQGPLKPPFNEVARAAAGFGPEWYQPLATKVSSVA